GVACYSRLEEVPGDIDLLQIYSQPGLNLLGIAQEAIQKGVKTFWIEDDEASDAVRKLLTDAKIYVVEHESLESEFRKHRLTGGADSPEVAPPTSIRVSDRMTRQPVTIMANDSMQDALNKMRKGHFRHLPVVGHGDRLIGMLSDRDLRLVQPPSAFLSYDKIQEQLAAITVAQAAAFSPVAVAYDAPLDEAVELMLRWQVGALPVVAGDFHLVGIITYSDILKEFLARARHSNLVVRKTDGLLGSDD
ncbi:MAG TPA: CBS domain-containing protein, partial [Candidatus Binatia bacterium]